MKKKDRLPVGVNWHCCRGDTFGFQVTFQNAEEYTITDVQFCVRKGAEDAAILKKLGDGVTDAGEGVFKIRVAPEETKALSVGFYEHYLRVVFGSDAVTILKGIFEVESGAAEEENA